MRARRAILVAAAVLAVGVPLPGQAQPSPPAERPETREYVRLLMGPRMHEAIISQVTPVLFGNVKTHLEHQLARRLSNLEEARLGGVVKRILEEFMPVSALERIQMYPAECGRDTVLVEGIEPGQGVLVVYSSVARGQMKLRRIVGWRKIAAVLSRHSPVE